MRLCAIASGSSGNCVYVGHGGTHLLVDAGISGKRIEQALDSIGTAAGDLKGILITHEHSDHIQGIGVMARKYGIPIYATRGTIQEILQKKTLGDIDVSLFESIQADSPFMIKDMDFGDYFSNLLKSPSDNNSQFMNFAKKQASNAYDVLLPKR